MDNESASPDSPKPTPPSQTARDPLIRYSVFAALGCAAVCMIFTVLYVFSYSLDSTLSFERHFDAYLTSGNTANLSTVLGLHMAQNRMFLQSCGMVAGIFFACLGLALFLVGIQGTVDATGQVRDYSTSIRRLAPGGVILLASMIFVGVSAMHPVELSLSPVAPTAAAPVSTATPPPAAAAPTTAAQPTSQTSAQAATQPATQPAAQPATTPPATQSSAQPPTTTTPATTAHLAQQSAPAATQPTPQPIAPSIQPLTPAKPATAIAPAQRPVSRPALIPISQPTRSTQPPLHHFQP